MPVVLAPNLSNATVIEPQVELNGRVSPAVVCAPGSESRWQSWQRMAMRVCVVVRGLAAGSSQAPCKVVQVRAALSPRPPRA